MNDRTTTGHLSLAFLGCGYTAQHLSRTLACIAPQVRRFYASRRRGAAFDLVSRSRGTGWFNSYESALADPRIDAAFIATSPLVHLELALAALEAGKHVILDPPGFLHPDDYTLAALAAERARRQVLIADNHVYTPLAERLRALIASGALGEIRLLHVNACERAGGGRAHPEVTGGSALLEAGFRWIGFLAHLGLTIDAIQGFRPPGGRSPERSALIVCEYRQGALGTLSFSRELATFPRGCGISLLHGTRGRALFESSGLFLLVLSRGLRLSLPGLADRAGYGAMARDFLRALATGTTPRYTLAHARRDTTLAQAACAADGWPVAGPIVSSITELPPRLCLPQPTSTGKGVA